MYINSSITGIVIIFMLIMFACKLQIMRKLMICGWCLISFVTIIGFLICSAFVLANFVSKDTCSTTETILSN